MIMRTFAYKTGAILILVPIFKSLIRPIIEYGDVVWHPYLRKNVGEIEKKSKEILQRKKIDLNYESRLRRKKE